MMLDMIPELALEHEILATINHVIGQISKFKSKISHFHRSLVEYFGILFVSCIKKVDEPDRDTYDDKINDQKEINERRLLEWKNCSTERVVDLISHTESMSKDHWLPSSVVSLVICPIL